MPKKLKPYLYPLRPTAPPETSYGQTVIRTGDQEQLTGVVQGMKASDLEERVSRSLDKLEIGYQFRVRISSQALGQQQLTRRFANVSGEIEIDFLSERNGETTPIFVDGQIAHFMTPHQKDVDEQKKDVADDFGSRLGWRESVRIPFWKLIDQDMTDRTIREVFV